MRTSTPGTKVSLLEPGTQLQKLRGAHAPEYAVISRTCGSLGGEKDFNVPIIGSEQMYQALKSQGIDTRLVVHPGQFHGLTPELSAGSLERYLAWLDKYLKKQRAPRPPRRTPGEGRFAGVFSRGLPSDYCRSPLSVVWRSVSATNAMLSTQHATIVTKTPFQSQRSAIQPTPVPAMADPNT